MSPLQKIAQVVVKLTTCALIGHQPVVFRSVQGKMYCYCRVCKEMMK